MASLAADGAIVRLAERAFERHIAAILHQHRARCNGINHLPRIGSELPHCGRRGRIQAQRVVVTDCKGINVRVIVLFGLAEDPLSLVRAIGHLTKSGVNRIDGHLLAIGVGTCHRANVGRIDLTLIDQQADRFERTHIEETGIGNHHGAPLAILRPSGIEFRRSGTALDLYGIKFQMFVSVLINHKRKPNVGFSVGVVGTSFDKFHPTGRTCCGGKQHQHE